MDVQQIRSLLEDEVAKKKYQKLTPEELARREETHRMLRERIAYHEAKTREQEDAAERKRGADG